MTVPAVVPEHMADLQHRPFHLIKEPLAQCHFNTAFIAPREIVIRIMTGQQAAVEGELARRQERNDHRRHHGAQRFEEQLAPAEPRHKPAYPAAEAAVQMSIACHGQGSEPLLRGRLKPLLRATRH